MGLLDFFKRPPRAWEDERFGTLRLDRSGYWTGRARFPPLQREVEVVLAGTFNRPNAAALEGWDALAGDFQDARDLLTDGLIAACREVQEDDVEGPTGEDDPGQGELAEEVEHAGDEAEGSAEASPADDVDDADDAEGASEVEEEEDEAPPEPLRRASDEETDTLWSSVSGASLTLYSADRFTLALRFDWQAEDDEREFHAEVTEGVLVGILVG